MYIAVFRYVNFMKTVVYNQPVFRVVLMSSHVLYLIQINTSATVSLAISDEFSNSNYIWFIITPGRNDIKTPITTACMYQNSKTVRTMQLIIILLLISNCLLPSVFQLLLYKT